MKSALAVYRLALVAYPRRFRQMWSDDMVEAMAHRLQQASHRRGTFGVVASLTRALFDTLSTALMTRFSRINSPRKSPQLPRQQDRVPMLHRLAWNLRQAFRSLAHEPAVAALIIGTLALGSGGTIAFFGIADAALVRPLPYPEPERLVTLSQFSERFGRYGWAAPFVPEIREQARSYDELVGYSPAWTLTMTDPGEPRAIPAAFVTSGLLELFGAQLITGRAFSSDEYLEGGPAVAVVSASFWSRHFGEAETLGGQTLLLDGTSYEIIGVVDDLRMPFTTSAVSAGAESVGVWIPVSQNSFLGSRGRPIMRVVGRLADGVTVSAAENELAAISARLAEEHPDAGLAADNAVASLADRVSAASLPILSLLLGASALLLCIACANVANLLLARASARAAEMSIRASLGATRLRLVEQLLTESMVLAGLGCGLGLAISVWLLRAVPALGFLNLPESAVVQFDIRVVGFAVMLSMGTALVFGLVPALQLAGRGNTIAPSSGTRATDARATRLRGSLVMAEVALAVILLVGAGLLTRSFARLSSVDPGFTAADVVAAPLTLGNERWPTSDDRRSFHQQLQLNLTEIPGIRSVASVNRVPLGGGNVFVVVEFESGTKTGDEIATLDRRVVTPNYFSTLGIPIGSGRDFDVDDSSAAGEPVAILNEAAVAMLAQSDPIGQRARLQFNNGFGDWMRVVGVAGDIHHHGLDEAARPEIYVPFDQSPVRGMTILMRTDRSPESTSDAFKAAVWQLDDELALDGIAPLEQLVHNSVSDPRVRMMVMQSFAALALLLAGIGVGGVVSYTVARRSREYGVRMALGAEPSEVLRLALRNGLVPSAIGALLGVGLALGLSRWVESLLFATSPTDPITYVAVTATLLGLVALASWIPARRATRVDPVSILRDE
ncbi:MAG: FtsX-like permease family protein [Acidobacteria bacterium]|nr:FtsX-like permease family protein [Acidobacteriota bacterium]